MSNMYEFGYIDHSQLIIESEIHTLNNNFTIVVSENVNRPKSSLPMFISAQTSAKEYAESVCKALQYSDIAYHPLDTMETDKRIAALQGRSQGFIGVISGMYGDVLSKEKLSQQYSIMLSERKMSQQHYEYFVAKYKWRDKKKHVAIFTPSNKTGLFHELCQLSKGLMLDKFKSLDYIEKDNQHLQEFLQEIMRDEQDLQWSGLVRPYESKYSLYFEIQTTLKEWREGTVQDILTGDISLQGQLESAVPDTVLGVIQTDIFEELKQLNRELSWIAEIPAVATIVYGAEGSGFQEVMAALRSDIIDLGGRAISQSTGHLLQVVDLPRFINWFAKLLGVQNDIADIATIAAATYALLSKQPINFMIGDIQNYDGGLVAFYHEFWQPFLQELTKIHRQTPLNRRHKFFGVLVHHGDKANTWDTVALETPAKLTALHCEKLLLLPPLKDFTREQLDDWIQEYADDLPVQELDLDDIPHVITRALTATVNDKSQHDPMQVHVLQRLRFATTWKKKAEPNE